MIPAIFSAQQWIATNCRGGHALKREAIDAISSFTLMWNILEGGTCNNKANIPVFKRRENEIALRGLPLATIKDGVRFWRQRYISGTEFNNRFQQLQFRQPDCREHVEAVLRSEKIDS
jgi:hypothetical protein